MSDDSRPPIFIVGSPRSGTTLLRLLLDSHPDISCGPETHFLVDMLRILGPRWEHLSRYGYDRSYWEDRIREFFGGFQADYARRRGKRRWADKSPIYTRHLDAINALFPGAQFVHIIRNGLDVVASFRERWGYRVAWGAASTWAEYVEAAMNFGKSVGGERYMELRYEALVTDPEAEMRRVLVFLGEPWDAGVLRYDQADHDTSERYQAFTDARRRTSGDHEVIYQSRVGAGAHLLDPLLKAATRMRSGRLLRQLGYS